MTAPRPSLSVDDVHRHVAEHVFRPHCDGDVGVELEWLTVRRSALPDGRPTLAELERLVAGMSALAHHSSVTIEPGGQLEVSTRPFPDVRAACEAAADDLYQLDRACNAAGIELIALGADPARAPRRLVVAPRYAAMNAHFDMGGAHGRTMMCNTAAIQLNVGLGHGDEMRRRWATAHAIGPVLIAAFANSPIERGRPSGWASSRMRTWWGIDPSRTAPVGGSDPVAAWTRYALAAQVMLIRSGERYDPLTLPLTFAEWIEQGHPQGHPTVEDLEYHLTTLFPPIRPRGWLELRMFDSLPTPYWHVAVHVATALLDDPSIHEALATATAPARGLWVEASRHGLAHPALAVSADRCFTLAATALQRTGADEATVALVADYHRRYVAAGRTPGDDRLAAWHDDGTLFPAAESPIPYAELEATWR